MHTIYIINSKVAKHLLPSRHMYICKLRICIKNFGPFIICTIVCVKSCMATWHSNRSACSMSNNSNENATLGFSGVPDQYRHLIKVIAFSSHGQKGNSILRGTPVCKFRFIIHVAMHMWIYVEHDVNSPSKPKHMTLLHFTLPQCSRAPMSAIAFGRCSCW